MNELLQRLADVERRLSEEAARELAAGSLTAPDPATGERWDAGQVWAHLAEFPRYWLDELGRVVASARSGAAGATPFGRTKSDPGRLAAIERDRTMDRGLLLERVTDGIAVASAELSALDGSDWAATGSHSTLGEMSVADAVERFIVAHLEEHADQLETLRAPVEAR